MVESMSCICQLCGYSVTGDYCVICENRRLRIDLDNATRELWSMRVKKPVATEPRVVTISLRGDEPPLVEIPPGLNLRVEIRDDARGYHDTFARIDDAPGHGSGPMAKDGTAHA